MEIWRRTADGWANEIAGASQTFELPSIGGRLAVDDLYATAGLGLP